MKIRVVVSIILISLFSCKKHNQENELVKEYQYFEDFSYYFKTTFNEAIKDINKEKLFIVPVSSCTPCVDEVLSNLSNKQCNACAVVFVGRPEGDQRALIIQKISNKIPAYHDINSELFNYQINIGKPSLLFLNTGHVKKMTLDYEDKEEVNKIIGW